VLVAAATLVSCNNRASSDDHANDESSAPAGTAVIVYTTQGIIDTIPASPLDEFMVRHTPIPDFQSQLDQTPPAGMPAMTMPFPLAEGVELIDLAEGDIVEIDFAVFYSRDTGSLVGYETREIRQLAAGTQLDFGSPDTPTNEDPQPAAEESDPSTPQE